MQQLRHLGCVEARLQFGLPRFERQQLVFDRDRRHAVLDRLNKLPDLTFDGRELLAAVGNARAMLHPQAIQLAHVLAAEVLEEITPHQLVAKRAQDACSSCLIGSAHGGLSRQMGASPTLESPLNSEPLATR
jgi:hypothetical protein